MKRAWLALAGLQIGGLVLAAAGLLFRLWTDDGNHWSLDIRVLWFPSGVALLWAVVGVWLYRKPIVVAIVLAVVACVLSAWVYWLDSNNLLVEYGLWIDRGMPEPWTYSY